MSRPTINIDDADPALEIWAINQLRGSAGTMPDTDPARFVTFCKRHGIGPLLAATPESGLPSSGEMRNWLTESYNYQQIYERVHQVQLEKILTQLEKLGIRPLILKGTALAYGLYPDPWLRPRGDTDLLVPVHDQMRVFNYFETAGFQQILSKKQKLDSYQRSFTCQDQLGFQHAFDIHWQINNRQVFAQSFPPDELWKNSREVQSYGLTFECLNRVYQLLHAICHRVVHLHSPIYMDGGIYSGDRLIWLYDIVLLVQTFNDEDWQQVVRLTHEKEICMITRDTFEVINASFPDTITPEVMAQLQTGQKELSSILLRETTLNVMMADFLALKSWQDRWTLFMEKAFPSAEFVHAKYGTSSDLLLPWLYLYRGLSGTIRQLYRRR